MYVLSQVVHPEPCTCRGQLRFHHRLAKGQFVSRFQLPLAAGICRRKGGTNYMSLYICGQAIWIIRITFHADSLTGHYFWTVKITKLFY